MFVSGGRPLGRARSALLAGSSCLELGYGRFMQTDPLGYDDGLNWYNYAHGDAVNSTDPTGTSCTGSLFETCPGTLSGLVSTSYPNGYDANNGSSDSGQPMGGDTGHPFPGTFTANQVKAADIDGDGYISNEEAKAAGLVGISGYNGNFGPSNSGEVEGLPSDVVVTGHLAQAQGIILDLGAHALIELLTVPEACCFTAGTQVATPKGLKSIESLKIGDLVMSRSPQTGKTAAKPIVGITPAHQRRIWTVTVSYKGEDHRWRDERYETTDDHPWRTADGHWVTSANLKHGQVLARENGTAIVSAVVDTGGTKLTYNLEIADFHTYFVGKAETWVHNSCPPLVRFPSDPSTLGHIFRVARGHYPTNTAQARSEIVSAINNGTATQPNQFGVTSYTHSNGDGTQTWVWVRNGSIYDAGYNPE